jgi:hypothetical protein
VHEWHCSIAQGVLHHGWAVCSLPESAVAAATAAAAAAWPCLNCMESCATFQQQKDLFSITATLCKLQNIRLQSIHISSSLRCRDLVFNAQFARIYWLALAFRSYKLARRNPMIRCFKQDTSPATSAEAMRCFTILCLIVQCR